MKIDEQEFQDFVGRFVADLGAVLHAGTVLIGDKLGLYQSMADGDHLSPADLGMTSLRPRLGGPAHGRLIDIG